MSASPRRSRGPSQPSAAPDDALLTQHQAFIRSLPCLSCGKPAPSECAYVGIIAGLGIHDRWLVPLCGPATVWQDCCHSRKHFLGAGRFWSELGIDLPGELARQLWLVSGDASAGLRAMARAREATARQHRKVQDTKESSWRSALDRRAAPRHRFPSTAMQPRPMRSEFAWWLESRS
jgi:hypothetical protein